MRREVITGSSLRDLESFHNGPRTDVLGEAGSSLRGWMLCHYARRFPGWFCRLAGGGAFIQRELNDAQHVLARRGFTRPDFKLARGLVNEHLASGNDLGPSLFR